jgi:hypothetical protein
LAFFVPFSFLGAAPERNAVQRPTVNERSFSMDSTHSICHGQQVLSYLENSLPGYPYDDDSAFVSELLDDFPAIDILEEIKAFRLCRNRHKRQDLIH